MQECLFRKTVLSSSSSGRQKQYIVIKYLDYG